MVLPGFDPLLHPCKVLGTCTNLTKLTMQHMRCTVHVLPSIQFFSSCRWIRAQAPTSTNISLAPDHATLDVFFAKSYSIADLPKILQIAPYLMFISQGYTYWIFSYKPRPLIPETYAFKNLGIYMYGDRNKRTNFWLCTSRFLSRLCCLFFTTAVKLDTWWQRLVKKTHKAL